MIEQMKLRQTFVTSEIQDGDVICFQAEISEKEYVSDAAAHFSPNSPLAILTGNRTSSRISCIRRCRSSTTSFRTGSVLASSRSSKRSRTQIPNSN